MAGHELIDAQLRVLAARLPAPVADELADGLLEAYEIRLGMHDDPERAARAAIAEFGDADTVTAAFFRASPWRRGALMLLATGPVMALLWGPILIATREWMWSIPVPVKVGYGLTLLAVVAALLFVVQERRAYEAARLAAAVGAAGLIILEVVMLAAITTMSGALLWTVSVAVPASLIRILLSARVLLLRPSV